MWLTLLKERDKLARCCCCQSNAVISQGQLTGRKSCEYCTRKRPVASGNKSEVTKQECWSSPLISPKAALTDGESMWQSAKLHKRIVSPIMNTLNLKGPTDKSKVPEAGRI